ncbi:hypothetical protein Tco_0894606 [Tanacetum coccineum]|uniref:Uncharacterized protein n=1 Tax=Tanacetum coccineum TaxID=301880 RepID=A0ABQ5CII4_9ASTR
MEFHNEAIVVMAYRRVLDYDLNVPNSSLHLIVLRDVLSVIIGLSRTKRAREDLGRECYGEITGGGWEWGYTLTLSDLDVLRVTTSGSGKFTAKIAKYKGWGLGGLRCMSLEQEGTVSCARVVCERVDDEVFPSESQPMPAADSTYSLVTRRRAISSLLDPNILGAGTVSSPMKCPERFLALPTPPPSPLSPYSRQCPQYPLRHYYIITDHPMALHMLRDLWDPELLGNAPGRPRHHRVRLWFYEPWDILWRSQSRIFKSTPRGVNQRVIELATTVDQEDEIIYSQLDDARYDRALLRARVNRLDSDRPFHRRTALLMEEEARLSRADLARSMDANAIRRQSMISDLLKVDSRRQRQLVEALKIVKSLKTQMIELQGQQGPAKDPAEPELPEEASSSS